MKESNKQSLVDHYNKSRTDFVSSGIEGQSHLEYYREKYPSNYKKLCDEKPFD